MLNSLKAGFRNPMLFLMKLQKHYNHTIQQKPRCYVMEEDWDNLLILDGCRFDLFSENHSLDGVLKEKYSPATCTRRWLAENFQSEYPDTVYVSANPQTQIHNAEGCFCNNVRVWDECWDDKLGTALPVGVTERAIEISQQYPNKRLIVHYVQPH